MWKTGVAQVLYVPEPSITTLHRLCTVLVSTSLILKQQAVMGPRKALWIAFIITTLLSSSVTSPVNFDSSACVRVWASEKWQE